MQLGKVFAKDVPSGRTAAIASDEQVCNICGGSEFIQYSTRPRAMCPVCRSLERTRAMAYFLDAMELVKPGYRVLHFAPEPAIGKKIIDIVGIDNYHACDINPNIYLRELNVKEFDLTEAHLLESDRYDLILHCHVLEHITSYVAVVLWHLQRALTQRGKHLFFIPMYDGKSASDFRDGRDEERTAEFGQSDHVRRFGIDDLDMTIGQVLHLGPHSHGLKLPQELAEKHNMSAREVARTMFLFGKDDLLLR